MYYTNANDLKNKVGELISIVMIHDIDIICITETMFSEDVFDAEVVLSGFSLFRSDRISGKGGGSCVYVKNYILSLRMYDFKIDDCLAVKLTFNNYSFILICMYRSPSLIYESNCDMINHLNDYLAVCTTIDVVLVGDFNLPNVDWGKGIVNCPINSTNKSMVIQKLFLDLFCSNNFTWVLDNSHITRQRVVCGTNQQATLDQILFSAFQIQTC